MSAAGALPDPTVRPNPSVTIGGFWADGSLWRRPARRIFCLSPSRGRLGPSLGSGCQAFVNGEAEMRIVVIGGGPAGVSAAVHAAELRADVTLIERGRVGGTAFNSGPAPVRTLA